MNSAYYMMLMCELEHARKGVQEAAERVRAIRDDKDENHVDDMRKFLDGCDMFLTKYERDIRAMINGLMPREAKENE